MDNKNERDDLELCELVLDTVAKTGATVSIDTVIEEVCNFDKTEAPEESHPLVCGVPVENAGVPSDTLAEVLKDECGSDTKG